MTVGEKIRYLREVEGNLRGLGRALTQQELLRGIKQETGKELSQSYLSQLESGARPHMTNKSRAILAQFFKVHPGYLVDDPEGYHAHLQSGLREQEQEIDVWLFQGADRFERDDELKQALITLGRQKDSRMWILLLSEILRSEPLKARVLAAIKEGLKERRKPERRKR
jgi:transcriptional regulator with XRE-family HTH domain